MSFGGEQREDAIIAWESPEQFYRKTFFGEYDPHNHRDCEILLEQLGPRTHATPDAQATELLEHYQLVARGEVLNLPVADETQLRELASNEIQIRFGVHQFFKGDSTDFIELRINSDMLSMPGEDRSRYTARQEVIEQYINLMAPHREREDELLRAVAHGTIDERTYEAQYQRVIELEQQYGDETGLSDLMSLRRVSSWLGDTFYERGGVIQPFTTYVIGVNKVPGEEEVYVLGELPESPSRIYWGAEGEEISRELDELTR